MSDNAEEKSLWDFASNDPNATVVEQVADELGQDDQVTDQVSDQVTETPDEEAVVSEQQEETKPDFDEATWLSEKTEGKYKSLNDLLLATEKEVKLDLEGDAAKIYQYLKEGKDGELAEYLTLKNTDFKAMDPQSLLKAHLEKTKPHLSGDDINDILVDKYGFGKEPLSDEDKALLSDAEIKAYERELRQDAINRKEAVADATNFFEKQKGELVLPDLPKEKIEGLDEYQAWKQTQAQEIEAAESASKEWVSSIEQTVPTIKELPLTLEVETSIGKIALDTVFHLNEERLNQVKEYLKGYKGGTEYDEKMFVKEGKIDFSGLTKSAIERLFSKEIREAQLKDFAAKYEEASLKELKRFDDGSSASSAEPYNSGISETDKLLNAIPNFN